VAKPTNEGRFLVRLRVAGRASIVGAAATHVGKVREHNEDAHFFDEDVGVFVVCDGMGGHAAGEVASSIAIQTIRARWSSADVGKAIDHWLEHGTPDAKKAMLAAIRNGAHAAHDAILAEAAEDENKSGMGTTLVGAMVVGNELVFAHAGDSRAYIVRDNIAMQLTEDHTLLSRLLAAGIDVDVSGEGSRFRSMLTNALGIGTECKISTFVVPLADGDRFLLCSDGISEYVPEPEVGTVLTQSPSPARAAQKLIDLALDRGGGDNATAVVIRVLEAGETPQPVALRRKDDDAIEACPLWDRLSPQQRLRALRIALSRDIGPNERLPAYMLGERVAWIIIEGTLEHRDKRLGPGSLLYPESLIRESQAPDRDSLAITRSDLRGLVLRADDFNELCEDDPELAELLHETLGKLVSSKRGGQITQSEITQDLGRMPTLDPDRPSARTRAETSELIEPPPPVAAPLPITLPEPTHVDLGSALRADLGGEHAVPRRRSGPKLEVREPAPIARAPTVDDEPEIEAVVEMEADAPPEIEPEDDDGEVEMTIEADEPEDQEPIILGGAASEDETMPERLLGPQLEEETIPERRPRTSESIAVSGTISSRPKRLSEGWGED
jgi:serine/threonine protein phosphatase PrpC